MIAQAICIDCHRISIQASWMSCGRFELRASPFDSRPPEPGMPVMQTLCPVHLAKLITEGYGRQPSVGNDPVYDPISAQRKAGGEAAGGLFSS